VFDVGGRFLDVGQTEGPRQPRTDVCHGGGLHDLVGVTLASATTLERNLGVRVRQSRVALADTDDTRDDHVLHGRVDGGGPLDRDEVAEPTGREAVDVVDAECIAVL